MAEHLMGGSTGSVETTPQASAEVRYAGNGTESRLLAVLISAEDASHVCHCEGVNVEPLRGCLKNQTK